MQSVRRQPGLVIAVAGFLAHSVRATQVAEVIDAGALLLRAVAPRRRRIQGEKWPTGGRRSKKGSRRRSWKWRFDGLHLS